MDIYVIILRLIHIGAGVFWVGTGLLLARFMMPAARLAGTDANKFMLRFYRDTRFGVAIAIASISTTIAGILLYLRPGASAMFTSTGWIVLSIGALAGLLAAGHGGAVLGRLTGEYAALLAKAEGQSGNAAEFQALVDKMVSHANISLLLLVISVIGMSTARYIG